MLGYLLSNENNATYNLIIGKIFGMCSAIYLNCVLTEYNKQEVAGKLHQDKYVTLTRERIFERTLLSEQKQIDVEDNLIDCSVLERVKAPNSPKFYYKVDEKYLMKILEARKDDKLEFALAPKKTVEFVANDTKKVTKKQLQIADAMKEINLLEPSPVVRELYAAWIDVQITKYGYVAKSSLRINAQELQSFSNGSVDVKQKVLHIAVKNGWKDIQFSINEYQKSLTASTVNTRSSVENKYQVIESKESKEAALKEAEEKLQRGGNDVF